MNHTTPTTGQSHQKFDYSEVLETAEVGGKLKKKAKGQVLGIIQARMNSSRLPEKVIKEIEGHPLLWHVATRLRHSQLLDKIVIATTSNYNDRKILKLAAELGIEGFAGSENDVLDRFYRVALKYRPATVVRLTADCPLIDPRLVDEIICYYFAHKDEFDYVHRGKNYPEGVAEVEVFSYATLERTWKAAKKKSEREHVTSYIWNNPQIFRIGKVDYQEDFEEVRLEVDEEDDLKVIREIYSKIYKKGKIFYWEDVKAFLKKHPKIVDINRHIGRNEGYWKSVRKEEK